MRGKKVLRVTHRLVYNVYKGLSLYDNEKFDRRHGVMKINVRKFILI